MTPFRKTGCPPEFQALVSWKRTVFRGFFVFQDSDTIKQQLKQRILQPLWSWIARHLCSEKLFGLWRSPICANPNSKTRHKKYRREYDFPPIFFVSSQTVTRATRAKTRNRMIAATDIIKSFGSLRVLKGISLEVRRGEIVSIVGASGAGKSTLLQILGTLSRPDGGSLTIDGEDVLAMNGRRISEFRNRKIGFVFQSHHLLPEFTALENVMIPAFISGKGRREAEARARELLAEVGLDSRLDHKPSELSGGEAQRVAIARALVNNPAVLFADEPSGNLDSVTKQEIHRLFFDMRKRHGQTVVIVTHDNSLAEMCDRKLTMRDGAFFTDV